uniref:Uncharacterized protein n=1 Tax=Haptolina brevifila TaxID=156173 RepID=A0A7S2IC63_9EUKA|mmetsp:Transcript_64500/g.127404  ORF Transcript_64500/g.127404 Transcript_64500/m.127404 type:complete len:127 (+) Transcript_64500:20-400(+)|eukprot:CAMPEP_0174697716 /NCGR_PEP_ID=MMETSP1094-20130205/3505_1 /TAXON_ID=156173 /ORGANISM="Chrysochromulina brevifilum, Strain UTEX LB 985" /LENGTH=126 /DNA_ID=CAMNT_0015894749 /DNA_START=18 /DNA_END=398 /DNA_ORIENTATION=-
MGKVGRQKKGKASRFDPLSRPVVTAMAIDDVDEAPKKQLSAHQARHLERKRLQKEAQVLKLQRGKVSKADKLAHRGEKKSLTKSLNAIKAEAALLRNAPLPPAATTTAAEPSTFQGFSLPMPGGAR